MCHPCFRSNGLRVARASPLWTICATASQRVVLSSECITPVKAYKAQDGKLGMSVFTLHLAQGIRGYYTCKRLAARDDTHFML